VASSGALPTRLGKYEIVSPLAAGGMARIYIARTTGIGSFERHVVLKLITPERANESVAVQMFLDEARLAASLNHQNVAQVFEVGEDGGIHYLAMEYVHGQDLRALLARAGGQGTRVPIDLALTVVAGAAAGLHHAHERRGPDGTPLGIVHRDVSPSNIMIGYDGSVKLLDFGIAKAAARSVETQAGIIKGKFAYMAPEQCRGRDVDPRSDVFSLGIILYEVTTQHRCFRADSDFDTMHRIVTGDVVRPSRLIQGYPQALEAIVMKALAVDAAQRYQSAGHLLEALEAYAVNGRMSLSTMALGRFMREMFGDQPEPWLTNTARMASLVPQKESTISSTNAPSGRQALTEPSPVVAQATTLLELPRGDGHGDEEPGAEAEPEAPNVGEWDARAYPTPPRSYAAASTLSPGKEARPSSLGLPPVAAAAAAPASAVMPAVAPQGSQPPLTTTGPGLVPAPVTAAVTAPGAVALPQAPEHSSTAGPGAAAGGPSTRHGYPSAAGLNTGDLAYPRYEAPENSEELQLKPSRRPYVIGAGVILVVLAVVIAMTIGGSGSVGTPPSGVPEPGAGPELRQAPVEPGAATPVGEPAAAAAAVAGEGPGSGSDGSAGSAAAEDEELVAIRVVSEPPGADVLLAGKTLGTTPLDVKVPKRTGAAYLTVHRAKYVDVTTRIDLSGDFTKEVTLKKVDEADDDKKRADEDHKRQEAKRQEELRRQADVRRQEELRRQADVRRQEELRRQQEAKRQEELRKQQEAKRQEELRKQQEAKKPKCQPPSHYNPFDTSCLGQPGASSTGACPACKDFK